MCDKCRSSRFQLEGPGEGGVKNFRIGGGGLPTCGGGGVDFCWGVSTPLHAMTLTYFTPCSSVSIVNLEQVNASWVPSPFSEKKPP